MLAVLRAESERAAKFRQGPFGPNPTKTLTPWVSGDLGPIRVPKANRLIRVGLDGVPRTMDGDEVVDI